MRKKTDINSLAFCLYGYHVFRGMQCAGWKMQIAGMARPAVFSLTCIYSKSVEILTAESSILSVIQWNGIFYLSDSRLYTQSKLENQDIRQSRKIVFFVIANDYLTRSSIRRFRTCRTREITKPMDRCLQQSSNCRVMWKTCYAIKTKICHVKKCNSSPLVSTDPKWSIAMVLFVHTIFQLQRL